MNTASKLPAVIPRSVVYDPGVSVDEPNIISSRRITGMHIGYTYDVARAFL